MNKLMGIVLVAGLAFAVGCEQKPATPTGPKTPADPSKQVPGATKDATKGVLDAAKEKVAEGAAALRDKAVEALKPQVEAAKAKLDELTKKADGLDAVKKPAATPLIDAAKTAFADLSSKFDGLKGATDGWEKAKEGVDAALKAFTDAAAKAAELLK